MTDHTRCECGALYSEDRAAVTVCTCDVEGHAKLIADALNWLQDE